MDSGTMGQWASAIIAMIALLISIISARSKKASDAISEMRRETHDAINLVRSEISRSFARIDADEQRITRLEGQMEHLPSKETTHRLETGMARLEGELKVMAEALKPVARIGERLQEFLLDQAASK